LTFAIQETLRRIRVDLQLCDRQGMPMTAPIGRKDRVLQ
jgi:hypothetical protein